MARGDYISVVEASYDINSMEKTWLQNLAESLEGLVQSDFGTLAYQVEFDDQGPRIHNAVQTRDAKLDLVPRIEKMAALLEAGRQRKLGLAERVRYEVYSRVVTSGFNKAVGKLFVSEFERLGPDWMYNLGTPAKDIFVLGNYHVDQKGTTALFAGLSKKRKLTDAKRDSYHRLSAHIKAAQRLRRRLGQQIEVQLPEGGAVLSANGRLLEADGGAKVRDAQEILERRTKFIDQARAQKSLRDEEALLLWEGLVQGEWSLVEQFDSDGKRFIIAFRNPEEVEDPRGLSDMECRVVGLAVRGYADALIGYHLGLPEGTVSSHLSRAMRKLRVASRADLVKTLGVLYPLELEGELT